MVTSPCPKSTTRPPTDLFDCTYRSDPVRAVLVLSCWVGQWSQTILHPLTVLSVSPRLLTSICLSPSIVLAFPLLALAPVLCIITVCLEATSEPRSRSGQISLSSLFCLWQVFPSQELRQVLSCGVSAEEIYLKQKATILRWVFRLP
jgi:hypothetical protein